MSAKIEYRLLAKHGQFEGEDFIAGVKRLHDSGADYVIIGGTPDPDALRELASEIEDWQRGTPDPDALRELASEIEDWQPSVQ